MLWVASVMNVFVNTLLADLGYGLRQALFDQPILDRDAHSFYQPSE